MGRLVVDGNNCRLTRSVARSTLVLVWVCWALWLPSGGMMLCEGGVIRGGHFQRMGTVRVFLVRLVWLGAVGKGGFRSRVLVCW